MNTKQIATFRAKMIHATSTPAEQARQLAALQAVVLGLLGLGTDTGGGAIPGPLGGLGRRWVMGGRTEDGLQISLCLKPSLCYNEPTE